MLQSSTGQRTVIAYSYEGDCKPSTTLLINRRLNDTRLTWWLCLVVSRTRSVLGTWNFAVAGPLAWNSLPSNNCCASVSLQTFVGRLKTCVWSAVSATGDSLFCAFSVSSCRTKRTGVLAMKIGVVPQWTKTGKKFLTTMFQVGKSVCYRFCFTRCDILLYTDLSCGLLTNGGLHGCMDVSQELCNTPMLTQPSIPPPYPGVVKWVPALAEKAKVGMVHSISGWPWGVQVKLWDPLRTRAIPEHLRGVFTTRR